MPFQKGQVANPNGRPKKAVEDKYLKRLQKCVTLKDWEEIIAKAIAQAKRGDGPARKWLSDYLLGTPIQKTELTGSEGNALKILVEYADSQANPATTPLESE